MGMGEKSPMPFAVVIRIPSSGNTIQLLFEIGISRLSSLRCAFPRGRQVRGPGVNIFSIGFYAWVRKKLYAEGNME